jgi:hypothetical protein
MPGRLYPGVTAPVFVELGAAQQVTDQPAVSNGGHPRLSGQSGHFSGRSGHLRIARGQSRLGCPVGPVTGRQQPAGIFDHLRGERDQVHGRFSLRFT